MKIDFEKAGKSVQDIVIDGADGPIHGGTVCVVNNATGPRVLIVAGIHGDEYEAQLALHRLAAMVDETSVRGRLIIVPEANFPASSNGTRCSPVDGANMNRTFPGNRAGSATERLAAFLFHDVMPHADILIDVHSGGPTYKGEAISFAFHGPDCAVSETAVVAIMDAFGLPYVTYQDGISTTFVGAAAEAGTAAIELEGGGTTLVESGNADIFVDGLLRGLAHHGVLAIAPPAGGLVSRHLDVRPENIFEAPAEGLLEHCVTLGQRIVTGDIVARVHPFGAFGGPAHPVEARADGIVISQRSLLRVLPGDCLGNTGSPR